MGARTLLGGLLVLVAVLATAGAGVILSATSVAPDTGHDSRAPIRIWGAYSLVPLHGVVAGNGSVENPFVIEGWTIDASRRDGLDIRFTSAHLAIRNVTVHSTTAAFVGIHLHRVRNVVIEDVVVTGSRVGIALEGASDVLIRNATLRNNAEIGISMEFTSRVNVIGSRVSGSDLGIQTQNAIRVNFAANEFTANTQGLLVWATSRATLLENNLSHNGMALEAVGTSQLTLTRNVFWQNAGGVTLRRSLLMIAAANEFTEGGFRIVGDIPEFHTTHFIARDNRINGLPIVHHRRCADLRIEDERIGQLILADCQTVRLAGLQIMGATVGIQMFFVDDLVITDSVLTDHPVSGMELRFVTNALLHGNQVSGNDVGLALRYSANATLTDNEFTQNGEGLGIYGSRHITIVENRIVDNTRIGLNVDHSFAVQVYHNVFIANAQHAADTDWQFNSWDEGYPVGGNYWSDHVAVDRCHGVDQDRCTRADAIGDAPFILDSSRGGRPTRVEDRYPLTQTAPSRTLPAAPAWAVFVSGVIGLASIVILVVVLVLADAAVRPPQR